MVAQKQRNFDFGQLHDLIANTLRMQQEIINRQMALQTSVVGELWPTNR